jgi:thioesterase domain-containing protein
VLAVETARLLAEAGHQVDRVLLFETWPARPALPAFKYYAECVRGFARLLPVDALRYLRTTIRYRRYTRRRLRDYELPSDLLTRESVSRDEHLAYLDVINGRAYAAFRTRYFPGHIIQFRTHVRDPHDLPVTGYGWASLCDELEVLRFDTCHDDFLREPNVTQVAAKVKEVLDGVVNSSA